MVAVGDVVAVSVVEVADVVVALLAKRELDLEQIEGFAFEEVLLRDQVSGADGIEITPAMLRVEA